MCGLKKNVVFSKNREPKSIQMTHYSVEAKENKFKGSKKNWERNHGCLDRINCGVDEGGAFWIELFLSDARYLLPDARICWILLVCVAFCVFSVWDDIQPEDRHGQQSDTASK